MADGADAELCWEGALLEEFCEVEKARDKLGYASCSVLASTWYICKNSSLTLCGSSVEDEAEIRQWVGLYCVRLRGSLPWQRVPRDELNSVLEELNSHLSTRHYLSGCGLSLADIIFYYGLHRYLVDMNYSDKLYYIHVMRWFDQIQHYPGLKPFTWPWVSCPKTITI